MKKNIILFISILLISTSFLSGCSNNNNLSNSKIDLQLMDFIDGNLTGYNFRKVAAPPSGHKFVYIEVKVINKMNKEMLTNPFYITIIDNENTSFMHFEASKDLDNCFVKETLETGDYFRGGLIYVMKNTLIPTNLHYFDPLNDINITLPLT